MDIKIPKQIKDVLGILAKGKFEAYIVGGCVRDVLREVKPKDWDITTNAKPEQIEKIFTKAGYKTVYENDFGTVAVITKSKEPELKTIEITPFRIETKYSDKRRPDEVKWAKTIEDDLSRRDFTVNAIAINPNEKNKVIDPFDGQKDLKNKIIKAVGSANERFNEDALRLIRAIRFAISIDKPVWKIETNTKKAISKNASLLKHISQERIRDELVKIIVSDNGDKGIELLRTLGLLKFIIPELELGVGVKQNKHHNFEVYEHNLLSLRYACENKFSKYVRIASLLHDIGKPKTKRGDGYNATFYNHELVGANMAKKILIRLRFSTKDVEKIVKLIRFHLFYYNVNEVGESSVRRLLRKVGPDNIEELLQLRYADRIGSGVPKAQPYKLRHLKYLLEKVAKDPISTKMLKINGDEIMKMLDARPSPLIGHILSYLLAKILVDPKLNKGQYLKTEVKKISQLSEAGITKLGKKAHKEIGAIKMKKDKMTKDKYWVS